MKIYIITLALAMCLLTLGHAQEYPIFLQSGQGIPLETRTLGKVAPDVIDGYYYAILQFYRVPSLETRGRLAAAGIELTEYVPYLAWLSKIPVAADLEDFPEVRALVPLLPKYKISASLLSDHIPLCSLKKGGIGIYVLPLPSISVATCSNYLEQAGFKVSRSDENGLFLIIKKENLFNLAKLSVVKMVLPEECLPEAEGLRGQTLVRANYSTGGLTYNGKNVVMAIGDDGSIDHEDFRNRVLDYTQTNTGSHGDMTVGLAIGASNINPRGVGMASGANLYLFDIQGYPQINNALENYTEHDVVITSTSYGEGCGGMYTYSSLALDQQVYENNFLLHCFSAGNSSFDGCNPVYGLFSNEDDTRFGNITGGRKVGKSAIAVGNLYYNDSLRITSSRGPTVDGRIKPDICAPGQGNLSTAEDNAYQAGGGTSAASPVIAGVSAILYQAYRDGNNQNNPNSGLIKATMLNTAEDLGNPGPDYKFGWGRVHVARALEVLQKEQYISGSLENGFHNFHQISVPEGVGQFRVMVYWVDPAASLIASKALVNDIDISLENSNGESFLPLVLSTAVNHDSLTKPAYPGYDRVNNMEQVSIDNPNSGTYILKVKAHLIPEGAQEYFVVYSYIKDEIKVSYPFAGEGFEPNDTEVLRWDAYGNEGNFRLEYSLDNQETWQLVSDNVPGHLRYYNWYVPNIITGEAFIRVSRAGQVDISDGNFTIMEIPDFEFDYVNETTASISWNSVAGANSYEVYAIGDKYMEVIGQTAGNTWNFPTQLWESNWYSIRAVINENAKSQRAYAKEYIHRTCNATFGINFKFDLYPGETRWEVRNTEGEVVTFGGPYDYLAPNSLLSIQKCLPFGCYQLYIFDSYEDGMCCNSGEGWFELIDQNGDLLTNGGEFTSVKILNFCLEDNSGNLGLNITNIQDVSCAGGSDGSALVTAHGGEGDYTYSWSNGAIGNKLINVSAGEYYVTISDGISQLTSSLSIDQASPIEIELSPTHIDCSGSATGAITSEVSGGTAPYSYFWSLGTSTPDVLNLYAGDYTLSIVDAKGCLAMQDVTIEQNNTLQLSASAFDVSCFGALNGIAMVSVLGGSGDYTYTWNTGATTANVFSLPAGDYTVTVNDNSAICVGEANVSITQPDLLSIEAIVEQPNCNGTASGSIDVIIDGGIPPYSFGWNTGQSESFIQNLTEGSYNVSVSDANSCPVNDQFVLEMADPMTLIIEVTDAVSDNNGVVNLEVSAGLPPYTYLWSNGASTEDLTNLSGGEYSVTVTDAAGCQLIGEANVGSGAFCLLRGSNTAYEWINSVNWAGEEIVTGPDGGLGNYSNTIFNAYIGQNYTLEVSPGFPGMAFSEYWKIWIDFNGDFDFNDPGEEVFSAGPHLGNVITSVSIPASAIAGTKTMRIAMQYGSLPPLCGTFGYGEVEEYTILLEEMPEVEGLRSADAPSLHSSIFDKEKTNPAQLMSITTFPNPVSDYLRIETGAVFTGNQITCLIFNADGQLVKRIINETSSLAINTTDLPQGIYRLQLSDGNSLRNTKVAINR